MTVPPTANRTPEDRKILSPDDFKAVALKPLLHAVRHIDVIVDTVRGDEEGTSQVGGCDLAQMLLNLRSASRL